MRGIVRRLVVWYSVRSRRRKASVIGRFMDGHPNDKALFIGVGPEKWQNSGIVERTLTARANTVIACDVTLARPEGWLFVQADARALPFRDAAFDFVLSNAVIEHVGERDDQDRFVAEHERVARRWAITTPNRWFPVESHTAAVFRHWSPRWRARQWRFTRLLSRQEFVELLPPDVDVVGRWWSSTFVACHEVQPDRSAAAGSGESEAHLHSPGRTAAGPAERGG